MERVYGAKMAENPTAVEAEVRRQMQERLVNHLLANEERKLTPSQRREKRIKKIMEDKKQELVAAVFRVDDLSNTKFVWKICTNAKQLHCSGVLVMHKGLNVLLVEGGKKAIKFMKKLMLRRINWDDREGEDEDEDDKIGGDVNSSRSRSNKCVMVWEGPILKPSFQKFEQLYHDEDAAAARQVFEEAKVPHYWDLAKSFVHDDAFTQHQKRDLLF